MSILGSRRAPQIAMAVVIGIATVVVTHWAWRIDIILPDELIGVLGARTIVADPIAGIQNPVVFGRGLERLTALALVPSDLLFGSAVAEAKSAHVLFALLYSMVSIPVYAMVREIGLGGWWAFTAGVLTIATPWTMYSETLLNGTLATLTLTVFLYLTLRGTLRPSMLCDIAIAVAGIAMVLARPNQIAFLALAPLSFAVFALRESASPGVGLRGRLKRLPKKIWSDHKLLVIGGILAILAILVAGVGALVGSYSNALPWNHLDLGLITTRFSLTIVVLTLAAGFVPAILAIPWLLRNSVRPESPGAGVYATLGLAAVLLFIVTTFVSASEERYIAVLVGIVPVAFVAALASRRVSLAGVIVTAVVISWLVLRHGWVAGTEPFIHFTGPTRLLVSQVLADAVVAVSPYDGSPFALTLALLSGLAVLIALGFSRVRGRPAAEQRLAVAVAGLAVLAGLFSAGWALSRMSKLLVAENVNYASSSWIDRMARGQSVGLLETGSVVERYAAGNMIARNRDLDTVVTFSEPVSGRSPLDKDVRLTPDPVTGRLSADRSMPRLLLVPDTAHYGIAGRVLARSKAFAGAGDTHALIHSDRPLRLLWLGQGMSAGRVITTTGVAWLDVYEQPGYSGPLCFTTVVAGGQFPSVFSTSPAPEGKPGRLRISGGESTRLTWRFPQVKGRARVRASLLRAPGDGEDPVIHLVAPRVSACR